MEVVKLNKVQILLKDYVAKDILEDFKMNYGDYCEMQLNNLGIDSLTYFKVIESIEEIIGEEIDYMNLDVSKFNTPRKIEEFLISKGDLDD